MKWIEANVFLLYIVLATSFYGFQGYTYVPQLVGVCLAVIHIWRLFIAGEKLVLSFTQKLLAIFFGVMILGAIGSFPFNLDLVMTFIQLTILYHVAVNILVTRRIFEKVVVAFLIGVGILIYNRVLETGSLLDLFSKRIGSTAGNQNDYGFILAIATLLILYDLLKNRRSIIMSMLYWSAIGLMLAESFVYAGSRTAIAITIVALVIYSLKRIIEAQWMRKGMIILVIALVISQLLIVLPDLNTFERMKVLTENVGKDEVSQKSSSGMRLAFMKEGVRLWLEKPLLGHGTNRFRYINNVRYNYYAHNNYVELLANNGLLGLILFYGMHLFLLFEINKKWSMPKPESLWWLNVILLCLLLSDMGVVSYYHKIYLLTLAIVAGQVLYYRRVGAKMLRLEFEY